MRTLDTCGMFVRLQLFLVWCVPLPHWHVALKWTEGHFVLLKAPRPKGKNRKYFQIYFPAYTNNHILRSTKQAQRSA